MHKVLLVIFFGLFLSCKEESKVSAIKKGNLNTEPVAQINAQKDSILYFENALIYEADIDGKKQEIWFYVNEKKGQILYVPKDEMIKAIVSFPNGEYRIYFTGEFKENSIIIERIDEVAANFIDESVLKSNKKTKTIDQKNIQQHDIICKGFTMNYQQIEGSEILFVTTQIPINALQIYGFARLQGDALFPINLDYLNVFKKNQLFTHVYYPQLALQLLNYGPNPYEFNINGFKEEK